MFGIDRLIAFAIRIQNTGWSLDVGGKWCGTDFGKRVVERPLAVEAHMPKFTSRFVQYFGNQLAFAEDCARALFQSSARTNECFPVVPFNLADEKDLDLPTRFFTQPDQPRRNHTRVIDDDDIIRTKIVRKLFEA